MISGPSGRLPGRARPASAAAPPAVAAASGAPQSHLGNQISCSSGTIDGAAPHRPPGRQYERSLASVRREPGMGGYGGREDMGGGGDTGGSDEKRGGGDTGKNGRRAAPE